ncbi:sodium- and chloride-dependent glycine transporter 1-like [Plakobranchus ocellatus]|uniref:Transporter n=1 Tax=Plakobranchus ocellatus TaxID=259542 RepID=A0AAV4DEI9_9GAST|nr:sodium- and chloride-dependent glycine transporter 1-like [Plakobranchus ocellatus]
MAEKKAGPERGGWDSWFEFLFSSLGSMVGLGNIWRFPYVCYSSGGGAFLIPFFVSMVVCGCPLIFLETAYCQYSNLGPGKVWVICPLFKGIGFGMMTVSFVVSIYYTVIMAWTLYYLVLSFQSTLPWSQCSDGLRSLDCSNMVGGNSSLFSAANESNALADVSTPATTITSDIFRNLSSSAVRDSHALLNSSDFYKTNEEAYWFQNVLNISPGLSELGPIQWRILACLLVAWILVFLCLIRGIKSMGKIVYVVATVPYLLLICLLIRGCLLPGAGDGLYFYMVPAWDKLLDFQVWRNAASQVFFSVGMGFGLISTLASYNRFHNNCYRDAMILPVLDCGTSVFAGLIVFSFLGYMADITGKSVGQVAQEGPGLVFVAYPSVLSTLPLPQLWSVLFFSMLFFVGLDSQGGFYILNLIDWYIASFSVMLIVFIEVMVLAWIYGTDRLYNDISAMIGHRPNGIFHYAWKYFTPAFVIVLWLAGLFNFTSIGQKNRGYPAWADILGMLIGFLPIIPIPIKIAWTLWNSKGTFKQRLIHSTRPALKWRPAENKDEICAQNEFNGLEEETALNKNP